MTRHALYAVVTIVACMTSLHAKEIYYIGNSHTDEAIGVMSIAEGFGDDSVVVGRTMVPGCPLWLLYEGREEKNGLIWYSGDVHWPSQDTLLPQHLVNHTWDAVVLQVFPNNGDSFEKTSEAAVGFAEIIYETNPDCQILIMTSHAYAFNDEWDKQMGYLETIYEPLANLITTTYPDKKPVKVIPVLQAIKAVRDSVFADTTDDSTHVLGDFLSYYQENGTDAHLAPKGLYLSVLTNYATIYGEDPHGAVTEGMRYWQFPDGYSVEEDYAAVAQDIVWKVVQSYPMAGVATTSVLRTTRTVLRDGGAATGCLTDLLGRRVGMQSPLRASATAALLIVSRRTAYGCWGVDR